MSTLTGERLRKARERKNLTQVQVKHRAGINNKTLSGYEKGVSEPDLETLKILANLYEVSVDWLTGNIDDPTPHQNKDRTDSGFADFLRELKTKYPGVNIDDPEIRRKLMKLVDLVLEDYQQRNK